MYRWISRVMLLVYNIRKYISYRKIDGMNIYFIHTVYS